MAKLFALRTCCGWKVVLTVGAVLSAGCTANSVKPPAVDAGEAAAKAIELCDKDGNGALAAAELAACPGLLASLNTFDTSKDKQLSREEIAERLGTMYGHGTALSPHTCRVTLDGRPLAGAHVRFVPEPFLGEAVASAEGDAEGSGTVSLGVASEVLPEKLRMMKLMQPGVYRVEITHARAKLPAKYNVQTTLGQEIHPLNDDTVAVFALQSR